MKIDFKNYIIFLKWNLWNINIEYALDIHVNCDVIIRFIHV